LLKLAKFVQLSAIQLCLICGTFICCLWMLDNLICFEWYFLCFAIDAIPALNTFFRRHLLVHTGDKVKFDRPPCRFGPVHTALATESKGRSTFGRQKALTFDKYDRVEHIQLWRQCRHCVLTFDFVDSVHTP